MACATSAGAHGTGSIFDGEIDSDSEIEFSINAAVYVLLCGRLHRRQLGAPRGYNAVRAMAKVSSALEGPNGVRCHQLWRMKPMQFRWLLKLCTDPTQLCQLRQRPRCPPEVTLGVTLHWLATGSSCRDQENEWDISRDTVARARHRGMAAIMGALYAALINADVPDPVRSIRMADPRFKYFSGCIGAIDGTHVRLLVGTGDQTRFRSRKSEISMNCLFAVNFSMLVTYALVGAEGAASDPYVLRHAEANGLPKPPETFYLCDAIFAQTPHYVVPYRKTRYHLREWRDAGQKPVSPAELFNLRHSQLRNVVERTFGVMKSQWQILQTVVQGGIDMCNKVVLCCSVLHNFTRITSGTLNQVPAAYFEYVSSATAKACDDANDVPLHASRQCLAEEMWSGFERDSNARRADELWVQYVQYCDRHHDGCSV